MAVQDGLDFGPIELQEVDLFVGISGSGKSKLLNSLFEAAKFAIGNEKDIHILPLAGSWSIKAEINGKEYKWDCERARDSENRYVIINEGIDIFDLKTKQKDVLVERTQDNFKFNGSNLPKLDNSKSCIELLQNEDKINPIYKGFTNVIRRNFYGDLSATTRYAAVDKSLDDLFAKNSDKGRYILFELPLSIRLYFISKYFKKEFPLIIKKFKELFPDVEECLIADAHKEKLILSPSVFTPIFMVTEKGVKKKIPLMELSSGMIKVLLILTDVLTMPNGFIYELDEYENSLGVNVINFFPTLLLEHQKSKQFLITTHHPYLINHMPVKNWYVLSRKGNKVDIKYGDELVKRYGKSSQESFINLINDPFYSPENQ